MIAALLVNASGLHLLAEYHGCYPELLDDTLRLEEMLRQAAERARAQVVAVRFHRFSPHGVTGVVMLEESHMSIHTWPELGYAAMDIFTCGACRPDFAHDHLFYQLGAERAEIMIVERGDQPPGSSLQVVRRYRELASRRESAADPDSPDIN